LAPEGLMRGRRRPTLDLFQFNRRVEDVDRRVYVIEINDELAELILDVLDRLAMRPVRT